MAMRTCSIPPKNACNFCLVIDLKKTDEILHPKNERSRKVTTNILPK